MKPPASPDYKVQVLTPDLLSLAQLEAFKALVQMGDEVDPVTLPGLVQTALAVGVVEQAGQIVAVGGIKRPKAGYRAKVFGKAGVEDPGRFPFELGWLFVQEGHRERGLSGRLVRALLERAKDARVYATSSVGNARMHSTLEKAGFASAGQQYRSSKPGKRLMLFVRGSIAS